MSAEAIPLIYWFWFCGFVAAALSLAVVAGWVLAKLLYGATVIMIEPLLECQERRWFGKLARREIAQAKANRVRIVRTNLFPDGEGIRFQRIKSLLPIFASVNVGAVSEVETVIEFHPTNQSPRRNFGHCERKRTGF